MAITTDASTAGLTMLVLFQIPSIYSNLLPHPCDLPGKPTGMIRKSEFQAGILAAGIGLAGSIISDSPWPFFGAVVVAAFLTWHYESSNRLNEDEVN